MFAARMDVRAANAIGVAMSTITTMASGPIGGTTDTRVPAARSPYASIRDVGLTSFGRLVCGAFLIPTNALTANNKGARDLGWIV